MQRWLRRRGLYKVSEAAVAGFGVAVTVVFHGVVLGTTTTRLPGS